MEINMELTNNELNLLNSIKDLSVKYGYCFAENKYLANYYKVSRRTIIRWIKKLEKLGYITITVINNNTRRIFLKQDVTPMSHLNNYNTIKNTVCNKDVRSNFTKDQKEELISEYGEKETTEVFNYVFSRPNVKHIFNYAKKVLEVRKQQKQTENKRRSYKHKPIRVELVPDWLKEQQVNGDGWDLVHNQQTSNEILTPEDLDKIEEMKKLQEAILKGK